MNTNTNYNVDVLICGGGVAGASAGIAAARNGMRTLLIEKRESLGGLCTNGYITGIAGHVDGICEEWVNRLANQGKAVIRPHLPAIEPESGKVELEHMLLQAGCRVLYGVHVADCVVNSGHIDSVIAYGAGGKIEIKAKIIIDTTGDAIVANAAGVPCEIGNAEFMGLNESTSMGFRLSYVNYKKYKEAWEEYKQEIKNKPAEQRLNYLVYKQNEAIANGDLPFIVAPGALVYPVVGSDNEECMDVTLDATHSHYCRNDSVEDLSRQIVDQHRKVLLLVDFMKKYMPGFENCALTHFAEMNGTRESRRIVGEYIYTAKDICNAEKFPDGIAIFPEVLDAHHPTSSKGDAKRHIHLPEPVPNGVCRPSPDDADLYMHPFVPMGGCEARPNPRNFAEVPYRALVASGVDNLLSAGRCLSADWDAIGAVRIIATSMTTGQAAGNAAALCVREGVLPAQLDGRKVREMQKSQGVPLDEPLKGYWARVRDMEGEIVISKDMAMIMDKDGNTSFMA
ncbi:MAG: FAD-dependent oxidoreductase [Ruminococcaceae bacterium]|nr:FAD-dependent oxidoreductase [Oscillospiraceae bacterium]